MKERLSTLLDLEEWRGAKVVEADEQREVRMPYRVGCHNYTLGVSLAFFAAATLAAYAMLWQDHLPESIVYTAVPFFVLFSAVGWGVVALAYVAPVRFYETMEERDE